MCCHPCIRNILFHDHAYRIDRGDNVAGIHEEEEGDQQEISQAIAAEEEEQTLEELLECPDRCPTSFLKGKPRSILCLLSFYKYHLRPLYLMH